MLYVGWFISCGMRSMSSCVGVVGAALPFISTVSQNMAQSAIMLKALADRFAFLLEVPGWAELTDAEKTELLNDQFRGRHEFPVDVPALVVRGEHSRVLTPADAQAFVDALPQGRFAEVAKCGHNVHTQNTPGFLDALNPFLADL